ncbi:MAG: oligosaccharide flippase family protein [Chitinophagales bacterium]|nr:oligosaccharide flippase family protein [Chitinophagales bacterium]
MGIVFRQSIKTSIVTLAGAVLGALITIISTYVLSKTELGLYTNIIYAGAIIQLIVMMGTGNAIAIYTQKYDVNDEKRKALLTFGMLVTIAFAIIFSVLYFAFKEPIIALFKAEDQILIREYYFLVPVLVFIWSALSIFEHYLIVHVKIAVSAFVREVLLRLFNLVLLGCVFYGLLTVNTFLYASVLVYIIPLVALAIISSKTPGFGFTRNLKVFSWKEYKDIINFSWYHLLIMASFYIMNYIDALMLGPLDQTGMESVGVYRTAVFIAAVMFMPFKAMSSSSLPILNEAVINKDHYKVNDLFSRAGVNILIVGIGLFVLIAMNLDNAVAILAEGYESVKPLVLILMLGRLVDMATGLNNELISISRYYKFNFRASALLLIMVFVLDRMYIPIYGIYGAAWVATISLAAFNIAKMIFLYRKMNLHPFTKGSLYVVLAGAAAAVPGFLLPNLGNPFLDATVRSLAIIVCYVGMLLWLKPSNDLVTYLDNIKQNKRLF